MLAAREAAADATLATVLLFLPVIVSDEIFSESVSVLRSRHAFCDPAGRVPFLLDRQPGILYNT